MEIFIQKNSNKNKSELSKELLQIVYKKIYGKDIDLEKIHKNEYGKPYYDSSFMFNISHSKNYICIAVGKSEIGIDIEEERKFSIDISKRILGKDEDLIDNNLLKNWVIKEAYAKYCAKGLYIDFRTINTNELVKSSMLKNISTQDYICYVYSKEDIEKVSII